MRVVARSRSARLPIRPSPWCEWPHLEPHDVKFAASKGLPTVDVLAGAPPCQPFSSSSVAPGESCWLEGRSGLLIFSILDVVAGAEVVVLENVEGFVQCTQFLSLFSRRFQSSPPQDCAIRLIGESLMPMAGVPGVASELS